MSLSKEARERMIIALTSRSKGNEVVDAINEIDSVKETAETQPFTPDNLLDWDAPTPETVPEALEAINAELTAIEGYPYEPTNVLDWDSPSPTTLVEAVEQVNSNTDAHLLDAVNFDGMPPATVVEALNRMAALLKTLNGGVEIP